MERTSKSIVLFFLAFALIIPQSLAVIDNVAHSYNFDDQASDQTSDADFAITSVTFDNSHAIDGYSAKFDSGSDSLISQNLTTDIFDDSVDFTIAFWANFSAIGGASDFYVLGDNVVGEFEPYFSWDGTPELGVGLSEYGAGGSLLNIDSYFTLNEWLHIIVSFDTAAQKMIVYVDGVNVGNVSHTTGATTPSNTIKLLSQNTIRANYDQLCLYTDVLTETDVGELYNSGSGAQCNGAAFVTINPYAHVKVFDLYDNNTVDGATVCLTTDHICNTTVSGVAYFYNYEGQGFNVSDERYFTTTGTALENQTTHSEVYGASVTINVFNVLGDSLNNFTSCPPETNNCNTTTTGVTKLLLKPNTTLEITTESTDGLGNITYINKTQNLSIGNKDTGIYNITNMYQTLLTVNVTAGLTTTIVNNWTGNLTGTYNTSATTQTGTYDFPLLFGDYEVFIDPLEYSTNTVNITIGSGNLTPFLRVPVYALNSFYLSFIDEITVQTITESMTIELISTASSGNYSTSNGSIALEILTPAEYTIRYRSNSYPERDYYQTLVNNNFYDLNLYSINTSESYSMIVKVVDTLGDPIEGAQVQLRRYFVGSNSYEIVEMSYSSYNGEAYFNAQGYEGHYKLAVVYGGRTLLTDTPENFVPVNSIIERTITFNTGTDYYSSYQALPDVARSLTYNNVTGTYSFSWNDPSSIVTAGCFYADYPNGTLWSRLESCQNTSAGNVLLTLPDPTNTTYRYQAVLFTNTNYSEYGVFTGYKDSAGLNAIGGSVGAFFGVMIIGVLGIGGAFLGAFGALLGAFIGVIFVSVINFLSFGWAFITGLAALGAGISIYLMRR